MLLAVDGYTERKLQSIRKYIQMVSLDRPVAPGLDLRVDLLILLAHPTRADPCTPQRPGDVFNPSYAHPGKIHSTSTSSTELSRRL